MQSIKAVRVQVISNTIASPPFSSTRVWSISFSVGPAYPQVGRLIGYKVVHLVNDQLIIPLLILSWTFSYAQEDIWSHTGNENRESQHWIEIVTPNFHSLISCVYWGYWIQQRCNTLNSLPLNIIDQSSLKQQVPIGKEVVTDQILIGSHCHSIAYTEGTKDIQDLTEKKTLVSDTFSFLCENMSHIHNVSAFHMLREEMISYSDRFSSSCDAWSTFTVRKRAFKQNYRPPPAIHDQQLLFTRKLFDVF